jgi:hypothetical protein
MRGRGIVLVVATCVFALFGAQSARSAAFVVTTTADSGPGSLRQAILDANASPGPDTIGFSIPGTGAHTISVFSPLPFVAEPTVIDGTSQSGYAGTPLIELDGSAAGANADGFDVFADNTIRGFVINRFSGSAISLHGGGNLIAANYLGTDASGTTGLGNGGMGILAIDSPNNVIGGTSVADRNVISANSHGIYITGTLSVGNLIQGNFIGTDRTGHTAIGNVPFHGVVIDGASNNTVGGATPGARNVVSGNGFWGISIRKGFFSGAPASGNVVQGNYVGTDVTGTGALGNQAQGIAIVDTPGNTIGGTTALARNVISGNHGDGVFIWQKRSSGNLVQGNFIGTDESGTAALGNASGVSITDAPNNTIGGAALGARNVISGNGFGGAFSANAGIAIGGADASGNRVQGNLIGTDVAGTTAIGNNTTGVFVVGPGNVIGGTSAAERNVISGTVGAGVFIFSADATGNYVQGNYIGTDITGSHPLGNGDGVVTYLSGGNFIGTPGAGNVIAANLNEGIRIGGDANVIQGNYVGTNAAGTAALGNAKSGIAVDDGSNNLVGGTSVAARNVVSGNGGNGIFVLAENTAIQGNFIGLNAAGSAGLGNAFFGVQIYGATNTLVGGPAPGAGNVIADNRFGGMELSNGANGARVQGDFVGTDSTGTHAIPNHGEGVRLNDASNTLIGGADTAARNVISGNDRNGVFVMGPGTANRIQGNYAGTDVTGLHALPNGFHGVGISGATGVTVGGTAAGEGNLLSGNSGTGIGFFEGAHDNQVQGNLIGTDRTGMTALGNHFAGVVVNLSPRNVIGGTASGARNTISANGFSGVVLFGTAATGNVLQGNFIGTDVTGAHGLGNGADGVTIQDAPANTVGGAAAGSRNLISGNGANGIFLTPAAANTAIAGNWIGVDISGGAALANAANGVHVFGAASVAISGNVISGNGAGFGPAGIRVSNGATDARVQGNFIGTDAAGTSKVPNRAGLVLDGASGTLVGGSDAATRNVISGNDRSAIYLTGAAAAATRIEGNLIGTDVTGNLAVGNSSVLGFFAIDVSGQFEIPPGALILRNVISGNGGPGVGIHLGADGNTLRGNLIGTNASGTAALGNRMGIALETANNIVGGLTAADRNVISGNGAGNNGPGVRLDGPAATGNRLLGNFIGTNAAGSVGLGNARDGVVITNGASGNTIGGTDLGARNIISANGGFAGVEINRANGNTVRGNVIGADVTGAVGLVGPDGQPQFNGIAIADSSDNQIGGVTDGAGNVIAFNRNFGVAVGNLVAGVPAIENSILRNSIFANGQLGIDLFPPGVTPNDPGDGDTGPNNLQNFPVLEKASTKQVHGRLNSQPGGTYRIEVFANGSCDPSGYGEGQRFMGAVSVTTNPQGDAKFKLKFSSAVAAGQFITGTATDAAGNTSEFSACALAGKDDGADD